MRRFLLFLILLALAGSAAAFVWIQSGEGGLVKLSDEEMAAAAASGEGARDIEIEIDAGEPLPTLEELEQVADRARVQAWATTAEGARGEAVGDVGDLLVLSAELERVLGKLELARDLAERGVKALPSNSRARLVLANCMLSTIKRNAQGKGMVAGFLTNGKLAGEMKSELEVALELDPNNHGARVRLAGMRAFAPFPIGSKGKAKELVAGIEAYDPFLRQFWEGQLLIARKKNVEAIAHFRGLLGERPGDPDVIGTIGELLITEQRWREAATEYEKLVSATDTPRGYDALYGGAKAREGGGFEREQGLAMLRRILEDDPVGDLIPSVDRIRFHEGNLLVALGRADEARAAYAAGLEAAPGAKRIEEAMAALQ